ncbi:MAG TPA: bifunctional oligoribonuclease/PAP phosphatase NrnA [Anaerolineae bacterium]|nr:bifunctional oligoribonuclease/PAP phosphatase NrnA [Anaerolineae bacterium]
MTKTNISNLLDGHRGERHVVVLHDYPDPDAIASAYAHRLISAEYNIDVDVLYSGRISHQQNLALVNVLGSDLIAFEAKQEMSAYDGAVFLDNQGTTVDAIVLALQGASVPILAVVDHHENQDRLQAEFSDIRSVGATSTIYADYIEQGALEMDGGRKEHVAAATGLIHGILSDTGGFVRAGAQDFRAAAFLSRFRDAELLEQVLSQARSKRSMDIIERALSSRLISESFSIAGVGYLRAQDRDAIPLAADFMLTEENVHTAIVYGIVRDSEDQEMVVGSLRTAKLTLNPDRFIKELFGRNSDGNYFGGGKPTAGGFAIPIGFLSGEQSEEYDELKWRIYDAQVKYKILGRLGVRPHAITLT